MKTLKLIAALLHYPSADLHAAAAELGDAWLAEGEAATWGESVSAFIKDLADSDLIDLQARYVATFDRGRAVSLHLFEHIHGESRNRGQAMVDLLDVYRRHGFDVTANELPDYLPLFLEFCAYMPAAEARDWLGEISHILQLLHLRLSERGSSYAVLFTPLLTLAGAEVAPAALLTRVHGEARDDTPEALDKIWAEQPVSFGINNSGSCVEPSLRPSPARTQGAPRHPGA